MGVPEWNLGWKQISDLYNDNLRYLRLEKVKKRKITEDRLRRELRFLMGSVSTLGPTAQHQARPTTKTAKVRNRWEKKALRKEGKTSSLRTSCSPMDARVQRNRHHAFLSWFWRLSQVASFGSGIVALQILVCLSLSFRAGGTSQDLLWSESPPPYASLCAGFPSQTRFAKSH